MATLRQMFLIVRHNALLAAVLSLCALQAAPAMAQSAGGSASSERQFTILIYERPADLARRTSPSESDSYWSAYDAFAGSLARAGALRGGSALSERESVVVRGSGSADQAVAGARLGGYFVIAASDLEAAQTLARQAPAFAVAVEVRVHRDNPHMAGGK